MRLLKIGDTYINFDLVTEVSINDDSITVNFVGEDVAKPATFYDDDKATLLRWLEENAEQPKKPRAQGYP